MDALLFIEETLKLTAKELLSRFGGSNNVREKKDTSLVTDADLASEKIILDRIAEYFPNDAVISEESGYHNVSKTPGQHVWIVDPLDGTTNFANGFPYFCTAIGRCVFDENGILLPVSGGVGDPVHQKVFLAQKGKGATCNGKVMKVKAPRPIEQAFLVTGFYYTKGAELDREIDRFHRVAQACQSIRRDGAAALDLALVACGIYDCFWERGLALWDMAAGSLLVTEAGGCLRNYPQAISTSLDTANGSLSYRLEVDGIIAGAPLVVDTIHSLLT